MYLISIYFDGKTEHRLQSLIKGVANTTGNTFMLENHVPPHITVAAIETRQEALLLERVEEIVKQLECNEIQFVSIGTFSSQVLFVQPVLNEYLHKLVEIFADELSQMEDTICSPYYQPFHWLPHCTIGKQLSKEQMQQAFEVLQRQFVPVNGRIVKIGASQTNKFCLFSKYAICFSNNL